MFMKTAGKTYVALFIAFCAVVSYSSDMLMKEAVVEDKTLGEVSTRIKEIKEKQIESNIYSENEISSTKRNSEEIDLVKNEKLKKVIDSLEKTVTSGINDETRKGMYGNARKGYQESVEILEKFASEKLEKLKENRELLEKQKELLKETQGLKSEMQKKDKMTEKDIDKMAEAAEKQENLRNQSPEEMKNKMDKATEALKNMDLDKAQQAQQEIVKDLEKKINEETQNENAQNADALNDMQQMMQQLSDMQQQLQQQDQQGQKQQAMNDQQRQDMAMKMDAVAEQMKKDGMEQGKQEMNKATENTLNKQEKQALQNVNNAMQSLQKEMEAKQSQMAQKSQKSQKAKPQEKKAEDSKESEPGGSQLEEVKRAGSSQEEEWRAKLPEKERDALLAARKAKYTQKMEEPVKRYFVELAK